MPEAFTAKSYNMKTAPKQINLMGKKEKPEPAQHIITFPGGAIEVSRTSDGNYWAHVIVFTEGNIDKNGDCIAGEVVGSRVTRNNALGVPDIEDQEHIQQLAVLIKPTAVQEAETMTKEAKTLIICGIIILSLCVAVLVGMTDMEAIKDSCKTQTTSTYDACMLQALS